MSLRFKTSMQYLLKITRDFAHLYINYFETAIKCNFEKYCTKKTKSLKIFTDFISFQ